MATAVKQRRLQRLRRRIEKLPPYPALLILAVPLAVVEPFKLVIVLFAGEGHWLTGAIGMICAYAISLFLTDWLFGVIKPKLLTIPWFARGWRWFVAQREKTWCLLRRVRATTRACTHKSGSMSASLRKRLYCRIAVK
jgi:hypothetical protein